MSTTDVESCWSTVWFSHVVCTWFVYFIVCLCVCVWGGGGQMHGLVLDKFKGDLALGLIGAIAELRGDLDGDGDTVIGYGKLVDVSVTDFFIQVDVAFAGPRRPGELCQETHDRIHATDRCVHHS